MVKNIEPILPKIAEKLLLFFNKHHFEIFLVGGYLRDYLINPKSVNTGSLDFATNATPKEILALFPEGKYENSFGTVILPLNKISSRLGLSEADFSATDIFEITTYRSEQGYSDFRHPDKVRWGKHIEEDLRRRDFTVNALAYNSNGLIDLFEGQKDLQKKIIRTVGDPTERFAEDALRMLRAVRMGCVLDFEIEEQTLLAIAKNYQKLSFVSEERIRDEFLKILASSQAARGVQILKDTNLLSVFLPEVTSAFGIPQKSPMRHHIYDVGTHLLKTLENCRNPNPIVRLACLLHDVGKPAVRKVQKNGVTTFYNHEINGTKMAYEIGKRLRLSKSDLNLLTKLVRFHQFTVTEKMTDNALRRLIRDVGPENILSLLDVRVADRIGSGSAPSSWRLELFKKRLVEVQKTPFSIKDLKIDGNDIMEILKIKPGPKVGEILKTVFAKVENKELTNDKETLIQYVANLKIY